MTSTDHRQQANNKPKRNRSWLYIFQLFKTGRKDNRSTFTASEYIPQLNNFTVEHLSNIHFIKEANQKMLSFFSVAVIACALLQAQSFSFSRNAAMKSSISVLRMSEDYTVVHAEAKASLLSDICAFSRTQMNEYVLALEKVNPTQEPARAALLNGVWEIVATGFGSPGVIGLQVIKAIPGGIVDINGEIIVNTISFKLLPLTTNRFPTK